MVPKLSALDAPRGEQLLQILLGIVDGFFRTGDASRVFAPVTLLNASRLLVVREQLLSPKTYAVVGMLHWLRHQQSTKSPADFDAAYRFFTHVYRVDPRVMPDGLREQFLEERPEPEPIWEIWHTHARTLVEEFYRDRGEHLLDHAIGLYRLSLDAAPPAYAYRPTMEYNLGSALCVRYRTLYERDDLDAAIASLERAAATVPARDPNRGIMQSALRDAQRLRSSAG